MVKSEEYCFLFDEVTGGARVTADYLYNLSEDKKREPWILTDDLIQNPVWHDTDCGWFVVQAASPERVELSRQWVKERVVGSHFMSLWKWDEIFAAFSLRRERPPSSRQINRLLATFGCLGPLQEPV